jgi:uncharacterized protein (DUF433 family)
MSKVVSIRMKDEQYEDLLRLARQERRTPSATAALLLADELRERAFPLIAFRDTIVGRLAFVKGSRIKVFQMISILRAFDGDVARVAEEYELPVEVIEAAVAYAQRFPDEIEQEAAEERRISDELLRTLAKLEVSGPRAAPTG